MTDEPSADGNVSLSRRAILRMVIGVPLLASLGVVASPLVRYFRPTMKAGNFFQPADMPIADQSVKFEPGDLPEKWVCIPFLVKMRYAVFSPQRFEFREVPAFILRDEQDKIVAYSRICPYCKHSQPINFVRDTSELPSGPYSKYPVLRCPCACDESTFDLNDNGRVLSGPATRPPRKLSVSFDGGYYRIVGFEQGMIS